MLFFNFNTLFHKSQALIKRKWKQLSYFKPEINLAVDFREYDCSQIVLDMFQF